MASRARRRRGSRRELRRHMQLRHRKGRTPPEAPTPLTCEGRPGAAEPRRPRFLPWSRPPSRTTSRSAIGLRGRRPPGTKTASTSRCCWRGTPGAGRAAWAAPSPPPPAPSWRSGSTAPSGAPWGPSGPPRTCTPRPTPSPPATAEASARAAPPPTSRCRPASGASPSLQQLASSASSCAGRLRSKTARSGLQRSTWALHSRWWRTPTSDACTSSAWWCRPSASGRPWKARARRAAASMSEAGSCCAVEIPPGRGWAPLPGAVGDGKLGCVR
mmetsp:Transcript_24487/g.73078  ORF Transcript_24487/g.73078 Transcript_24487/m.73078 type:complete len:272 (+) Transcript_24487:740-1555(+)